MHEVSIKQVKSCFLLLLFPIEEHGLEYETDSNDILYVRIDRTRKLPVTVLVRALGYGTDTEINRIIRRR